MGKTMPTKLEEKIAALAKLVGADTAKKIVNQAGKIEATAKEAGISYKQQKRGKTMAKSNDELLKQFLAFQQFKEAFEGGEEESDDFIDLDALLEVEIEEEKEAKPMMTASEIKEAVKAGVAEAMAEYSKKAMMVGKKKPAVEVEIEAEDEAEEMEKKGKAATKKEAADPVSLLTETVKELQRVVLAQQETLETLTGFRSGGYRATQFNPQELAKTQQKENGQGPKTTLEEVVQNIFGGGN